jgi:heme exporter protein D
METHARGKSAGTGVEGWNAEKPGEGNDFPWLVVSIVSMVMYVVCFALLMYREKLYKSDQKARKARKAAQDKNTVK